MIKQKGDFKIDKFINRLKKEKSKLPIILGNIAKNFFLMSWRNQGFTNVGLNAWAKRKKEDKGKSRAILVKTGHLRRSIKVLKANFNSIKIGSYGVSYAKYHNEGIEPQPERRFIGESQKLNQQIQLRIKKELTKVFKLK